MESTNPQNIETQPPKLSHVWSAWSSQNSPCLVAVVLKVEVVSATSALSTNTRMVLPWSATCRNFLAPAAQTWTNETT